MLNKIAVSLAAALAAVALMAGPAAAGGPPPELPAFGASASPVLITFGTDSQDGVHSVTPQCTAGPGVSRSLGTITYVVQGSADATSTNGSVGIGTALTCWIIDRRTAEVYGTVSGGLPGPHGQAEGTIDVPLQNSDPYLCATANAVFNDNGTADYDDC
jgi:hypothetical protein